MEWLYEIATQQLSNQFAAGGLVVVVFGALLAMARNVPYKLFRLLNRLLVVTVDISDRDPAFFWVQSWLGRHPYTTDKAKLLTASTLTSPVNDDGPDKNTPTDIIFSPAPGNHLIWFSGMPILVSKVRREAEALVGAQAYHETMIFRSFSKEAIKNLILQSKKETFPEHDDTVCVYVRQRWDWVLVRRRKPRSLESVILSENIIDSIVKDVRWFVDHKDWYDDKGIPYQRGYILTGPPGTGKSSTIAALAGVFKKDLYMMNLSSLHDGMLQAAMNELPSNAFLLVEDVDCVFDKRTLKEDSGSLDMAKESLTFSGFLNAIDGVAAKPGRLIFMTTNHPEKLDAALMRPGRIDKTIKFGYATPDQARRLYLRFYPGQDDEAVEFSKHAGYENVSMAALQEALITGFMFND